MGETEWAGRSIPEERPISWTPAARSGELNRQRQGRMRHRVESSQLSAPSYRERRLMIVSSTVTYIDITDELGKEVAISSEVVVQSTVTETYLLFAVFGRNRATGAPFPRRGTLILDTICLERGSRPPQTSFVFFRFWGYRCDALHRNSFRCPRLRNDIR